MIQNWHPIPGGITAPKGFLAAGITAGLKPSGALDLALLVAPNNAVCSGTFTRSVVRAACVDLCSERLIATAGRVRAVLINSGHANACTGERGLIDSHRATHALATRLGVRNEEVLICSTGVIGVPIPMDHLIQGLDPLMESLSADGGARASQAILTTDLVEKQIAIQAVLEGRAVRIAGMAKGSGMIHPDMATMLAYLTCDVGLPRDVWQSMITRAVGCSFNAITVDGDTSTNDTVLAFAAGDPLEQHHFPALEEGVRLVTQHLAKAIARDGEGATCLIEARVAGCDSDADARKIAKTICGSSLVKTAVHGHDPNWGRIVAAAGRAGVQFDPDLVALWLGDHQLMANGQPLQFDHAGVSQYMQERVSADYLVDDVVKIHLDIGNGVGQGFAWGCDLSDQYVRINADYTT